MFGKLYDIKVHSVHQHYNSMHLQLTQILWTFHPILQIFYAWTQHISQSERKIAQYFRYKVLHKGLFKYNHLSVLFSFRYRWRTTASPHNYYFIFDVGEICIISAPYCHNSFSFGIQSTILLSYCDETITIVTAVPYSHPVM